MLCTPVRRLGSDGDLRREFEARIESRAEELVADLDAAEAAAEAA
jgi:hypothetical protein